jgi:hypothetical protein
MIVYVNGRGMNAPELKAYISELEAENAELKEKQESADRQIAEYKRILKAAVDDVRYCMCSYDPCEVCALLEENGECVAADDDDCSEKYKWRYEAEALALIGEEGDTE